MSRMLIQCLFLLFVGSSSINFGSSNGFSMIFHFRIDTWSQGQDTWQRVFIYVKKRLIQQVGSEKTSLACFVYASKCKVQLVVNCWQLPKEKWRMQIDRERATWASSESSKISMNSLISMSHTLIHPNIQIMTMYRCDSLIRRPDWVVMAHGLKRE